MKSLRIKSFREIRGLARKDSSREGAFTFIEVLATLAFLVILIPVIVEALTISSRAAAVSERSAIATELAENKISEMVITGEWMSAAGSGDFGKDWPGYQWTLTQTSWSSDNMVQLTLTVSFQVQGQSRELSLTTLANSSLGTGSSSTSGSTTALK